jgi:hypothetical protein
MEQREESGARRGGEVDVDLNRQRGMVVVLRETSTEAHPTKPSLPGSEIRGRGEEVVV